MTVKCALSFLIFSVVFLLPSLSQSKITKQVINGQYSIHRIDKLNILRPDKYNSAVNNQLGIMGNDFFGLQPLSSDKNDNSLGTPTDYWILDTQKRTVCGKILQQYFREPESLEKDDDLNMQIVCYPKDPAFESKYIKIKNQRRNTYPWAMFQGEIDIDDGYHKFFNPKNSNYKFPVINNSDVCLYGPWVEEVYDSGEDFNTSKDHVDVNEIHPAEQFWWAEKTQTGFYYYLNAANDASGRFGESGWTSNESRNTFAIAFDIKKRLTDKIVYQIINVCNQGTSAPTSDGQKHYLMLGNDTLMQVEEPAGTDILSVTFVEVGLDPYSLLKVIPDSIIKGFLVLESTIKNQVFTHGNLKLMVNKKIFTKAGPAQFKSGIYTLKDIKGTAIGSSIFKKVKVTLKEITSLENSFSAFPFGTFNLTGYIYAEKELDNLPFSKSSSEILEDKAQLLFPLSPDTRNNRVIKHDLGLKGIGFIKSTYNKSVYFFISPNEKINIITDFEAGYIGSSIRTLELINQAPFYELQIDLSELQKNVPIIKEIVLQNRYGDDKYKMKIKMEFLLLE